MITTPAKQSEASAWVVVEKFKKATTTAGIDPENARGRPQQPQRAPERHRLTALGPPLAHESAPNSPTVVGAVTWGV